MAVRIVRLAASACPAKGCGSHGATAARGVPKSEYAKRNFYDVWLPSLAPSEDLLKVAGRRCGPATSEAGRPSSALPPEMKQRPNGTARQRSAALSRTADFSLVAIAWTKPGAIAPCSGNCSRSGRSIG